MSIFYKNPDNIIVTLDDGFQTNQFTYHGFLFA